MKSIYSMQFMKMCSAYSLDRPYSLLKVFYTHMPNTIGLINRLFHTDG